MSYHAVSTKRVYSQGLEGFTSEFSPCEVCGAALDSHEWADLDANGYVTKCSNVNSGEKNE